MKLPVGMLVYLVERFDADRAMIGGFWYYKEMRLPSTIEEKKHSLKDYEAQRCTGLFVNGSITQILDLLVLGDRFNRGMRINEYSSIVERMNVGHKSQYLFDDVNSLKGTAWGLDMLIDVEEDNDTIFSQLNSGKRQIALTIAPDWSFSRDVLQLGKT